MLKWSGCTGMVGPIRSSEDHVAGWEFSYVAVA